MQVTIILTLATAVVALLYVVASHFGLLGPSSEDKFRGDLEDDDGCAACGHRDVLELAPGAYLCPSCGYEGGANLARVKWLAEMATLKERPIEQQQEVRRAALEEGRLLTTVGEGELQRSKEYRAKADSISPISKEARAQFNELNALADAAIASAISPTLEAISQLETVEFLSTGTSTMEPLRSAIVDASNIYLELAATEAALQRLRALISAN